MPFVQNVKKSKIDQPYSIYEKTGTGKNVSTTAKQCF
jgi:hypothetical protein